MMNSTFRGTPFDWQFSNPHYAIDGGAPVFSGPIVVYSQADLDALFGYRRAVNRRQAGDPTAGGTSYIDYWGPDPSGALVMSQPPIASPTTPPGLAPSGSGSSLVAGYYSVAYAWVHPTYLTSPIGPASGVSIAAGQFINYQLDAFPPGVTFADLWLVAAPTGVTLGKLGSAATPTGGLGNPPATPGTPPYAGAHTTYQAILSKLEKPQTLPGGVHFCDVEFTMVAWPPTYA
jgi:hypothetical protein